MNAAPINPAQIIADSYAILSRGDPRAAEVTLAQLWNAGPPPPPQAMHLLGLIRSAQGRIGDAELLMRQSIDADPTNAEYHNNLGRLLRDAGYTEHALPIFEEAVRHGPKLAPARLNLIRALAAAGRLDDAETHARKLVSQKPDAAALTALGGVLRDQRRSDNALAAFDAALKLEPQSVNTRLQRAITLDRIGRGDEALAIFEALHREGARGGDLYGAWANALVDLGRAGDAEARLAEAITRQPANAGLQTSLAKVRWVRGDTTGFARDFEAAVRAQPDNFALRVGCADMLRRGERLDDALALMRAGLARAPDEAGMLATYGALCMDAGDTATALPALERARKGRPHDWTLRQVLATTLLQANRPDDALAHIRAGVAAHPTDSSWLALDAVALRMRGDPAYAALYDFDAMVRVYDLPTPDGYASMTAFNEALAHSLRTLHTLDAHPIDQSLRHGTQTSQDLLESTDPAIVAFLALADAALDDYVATMPGDAAHPIWSRKPASGRARKVGCWSVRLKPGGFHVNHVHPEGWISSAYYVALPPGVAGANDHQGWIQFGEPRWPMPGVTAERFIEPRVGRLVLFPSCMWHGTVPFRDGDERLSIAFDAVPESRS